MEETRGGRPDFDDSEDVLTWRYTFKRVVRPERAFSSAVADLSEFSVSTAYRLGIAAS